MRFNRSAFIMAAAALVAAPAFALDVNVGINVPGVAVPAPPPVYVPAPQRPSDAAATRADFAILSGRSGGEFASVVLDETSGRGSWHVLGTFPVGQSGVAVRLTNEGATRSAADRLGVSQVRASCMAQP